MKLNINLNKKNDEKSKSLLLSNILIFISIAVSLYILIDKRRPVQYEYLPLLPLFFGTFSIFFINNIKKYFNNTTFTLVYFSYSIRCVILPLILCLNGYNLLLGEYKTIVDYSILYKNMNFSIILSIYELMIVFLVMRVMFFLEKFTSNHIVIKDKVKLENVNNMFGKKAKYFISISTFIILLSVLFSPQLLDYFSFFIETSEIQNYTKRIELLNLRNQVPPLIYWTFVTFVRILQVFLPIILIYKIYVKYEEKNQLLGLIFSIFVITIVFTIMTPEKINSVVLALILLIITSNMYEKYKKYIFILLILLISFSILGLFYKSGLYKDQPDVNSLFSSTVNAYFSGIINISAAVSMVKPINLSIVVSDFINSIPFMSYFFKNYETTPQVYNEFIKGSYTQVTKIIPMIGQGNFYFGFIFSPIFSLVSILLAFFYEKKVKQTKNFIEKYIYLYACISFAISPIMYNLNIAISNFFFILIYTYLISSNDKYPQNMKEKRV
ncbi:hypothetical protein Exig_2627 [Exiguobacterium sibiricum 255-15]|uniref:Oligosaccharide repeat unit polymerase n=1 Tax=Exiguobacterium sibiricum (strain DSM 17290 / CCUG 55495 / CIP 109462 / JCM 13490 / 255-15) TaxID=262543 RepID=B1YML5_EXIS2|nr:hypothetical protein [Exiguobacterium sibiricum]ACB62075.1 hypothetical protein Exig_2627 [Exiguobacterium sibiricum 255-15]